MANPNLFNSIKLKRPKMSRFDLSHDVKLSLNMGDLVPIMVQECVPGDRFTIGCESLLRFQPLIAPVMHRFDISMHYFFVPNRLTWDQFPDWISGNVEVVPPYIPFSNSSATTYPLSDYMGIPTWSAGHQINVSALPFAAYQMIYNDYYRDENLVPEVNYKLSPGSASNYNDLLALRKRAWEKDYFTAALPWAQKGSTVDIPLGDITYTAGMGNDVVRFPGSGTPAPSVSSFSSTGSGFLNSNMGTINIDNSSSLSVQPTTINDLRTAYRVQEWLEKNARGGTRYNESIYAHFGVKSSDARLQRPEYITGIKSPVIISEVLNTTGEDGGLPQGNMAGHGVGVSSGKYGKYYCEEHGFIIGIMSVLPLPAYQQGIARHFGDRNDRFDYYWPEFAHLGEQEIRNKEIYADSVAPNGVFGYTPRYAEYKYQPSRVARDLRTTLDFWTAARIFDTEPALNQQFIEMVDDKRIFAVIDPNEDSLIAHVLNKVSAVRPMPFYGTPMT